MRIVTSEQMKTIENNALLYSLNFERLMENAGAAAAAEICRAMPVQGRCVTLFCGRGNNGGDGFVVARLLQEAGADAAVVLTDGEPKTAEAIAMFRCLPEIGVPILQYGGDPAPLTERLAATELLVDAIYGTGFHGELDERHRDICRLMNGLGVEICALDIPSGVCADSGLADACAIRAATTVVFDSDKPATIMPCAAEYCGAVTVADIGIPEQAHQGIESRYTLADNDFVFSVLEKRRRNTHKGSYGKLLNIAGCARYMGAALLSSLSAMRTGAGYVTLASTKEVCRTILTAMPEAVMLPLKQTSDGAISYQSAPDILETAGRSTAVLLGNGLGTGADACHIVYDVLQNTTCPVILDADGINAVSRNIDILKQAKGGVILTPHLMEFSRLTTLPAEQLLHGDLISVGRSFAEEYGVTLVLKGAYTTTVTPEGHVYVNTTGNAGLAKAGSGDVLAGIIGALAAQGRMPALAASCGVYLHGLAGDYAAEEFSQYGMVARDVIDALARALADNGR